MDSEFSQVARGNFSPLPLQVSAAANYESGKPRFRDNTRIKIRITQDPITFYSPSRRVMWELFLIHFDSEHALGCIVHVIDIGPLFGTRVYANID